MNDLRAQLQSTLGDGYTLERELGGGGMSRLFVARDNALGRDVVVNVLSPPALQEPHIVRPRARWICARPILQRLAEGSRARTSPRHSVTRPGEDSRDQACVP